MSENYISEMAFPVVLYAKDGWIEIFKSEEGLMMWSRGSLRRYLGMGLYFLDSTGWMWMATGYDIIEKPTLRECISMIKMGLPPISKAMLRLTRIQKEGVCKFRNMILERPPKKRVRFSPKDLDAIRNVETMEDLRRALDGAGVPVTP